jgi:hypothetical protein
MGPMEREPRPIIFPRTELAEIPADKFSFHHVFYSAIQRRYPNRISISEHDNASKLGKVEEAKVFFTGGPELPHIRKNIQIAQAELSTSGILPIVNDVSNGNWRSLLVYIQHGSQEYYDMKQMKNVVSSLGHDEMKRCLITAFNRAKEVSGGLPPDVEKIYRAYSAGSRSASSSMLVDKVSNVIGRTLDRSQKAA